MDEIERFKIEMQKAYDRYKMLQGIVAYLSGEIKVEKKPDETTPKGD